MHRYTTQNSTYSSQHGMGELGELGGWFKKLTGKSSKKVFKSVAKVATLGVSENKKVRKTVKKVGEKWNVGNNTQATLKSVINTVGVVSTLMTAGAAAGAFAGSATVGQGAMAAGELAGRDYVKGKVVGKLGEKAAKPFVKRIATKAQKKARATLANAETGRTINTDAEAKAAGLLVKPAIDKTTGEKVSVAIDPATGKEVAVRRGEEKTGGGFPIIPVGLVAALLLG